MKKYLIFIMVVIILLGCTSCKANSEAGEKINKTIEILQSDLCVTVPEVSKFKMNQSNNEKVNSIVLTFKEEYDLFTPQIENNNHWKTFSENEDINNYFFDVIELPSLNTSYYCTNLTKEETAVDDESYYLGIYDES